MQKPLILASGSQSRKVVLSGAGLQFSIEPARIDEREVEESLEESDQNPANIARSLAMAKALDVSSRNSGAYVIGSDQTLSLGAHIFHKPKDMVEAANHIRAFSGQTHHLNCGLAIAFNGLIVWSGVSIAAMTMRAISEDFLARYLEMAGPGILQSVGAYQFEGPGIQLFEKIDGDYFTILGLPLLDLLKALRALGAIDA
ncbi:Maf-like protein [Rhizobium alvei]|uniref:Nucleoside triphosphate pyrophosphatase n=1 Tax=Rhizobium alvei TaxID=1132659 RepID=A0ABT8YLY5_9HYPH|nr:Maf-like protein [Rhizobium alvei]MDO6964723.1 Maf-like protein [Rhizobium alvei]